MINEINENEDTSDCLNLRFLQSPFWACFKSRHGWKNKKLAVTATVNGAASNGMLPGKSANAMEVGCRVSLLFREFRLLFLRFTLVYIPLAPEIPEFTQNIGLSSSSSPAVTASSLAAVSSSADANKTVGYAYFLVELALALKRYLPKNTLCVRYDIPVDFYAIGERDLYVRSLKNLAFAERLKLKKSRIDVQPPDTVILDLSKSVESILSEMHSKWRYNIRLAEKKGVRVKVFSAKDAGFDEALDIFYDLYKTTASRDGIEIHLKSYYKDLLSLSASESNAPDVRLYIASVVDGEGNCAADGSGRGDTDRESREDGRSPGGCNCGDARLGESGKYGTGEPLAAIIVLFCKREAVYLYGASGNKKRNFMPSYLLQWRAINDAKKYGSAFYDLYGMPPSDDERHPMHGLYRFKTGFGGKIIHRPGSMDVPLSFLYFPYVFLEALRSFYHKKIKKIFVRR
ncbi:lipid II:glycine glycyltransferase FemX [Treponema parvum]|uniref:lipid II:glycine glycyltransferase FemX n=1 Tax=Treponema parvum TaxID=138851 RepID=UPI001FE4547A|nr:peptidoglycan bridge formation glycyltransferase FemA/FemB family protein [Treponema parvum]